MRSPRKFRGYDEENQCWRYGHYYEGVMTDSPICIGDCRICRVIIVDGVFYHVVPESVGQFTGLCDKDGAEVYEGDIVKATLNNSFKDLGEWIGVVTYEGFEYCLETTDDQWPIASWSRVSDAKIIGNAYENPELLK